MRRMLIVASVVDPAGMNISQHLRRLASFKERDFPGCVACWMANISDVKVYLVHVESDIIYCEGVEKPFNPELVVYASRHSSSVNIPALTVHVSGNWGNADYGGSPRTISVAYPKYVKAALRLLHVLREERSLDGFTVSQEQTHHGPTVNIPSMFIEIGSSRREWVNQLAGEIIADTILQLVENPPENCVNAVGFGGGHYAPKFTHININSSVGVGHIASKYHVPFLDRFLLSQAIEKTVGGVEMFILDWKGLKSEDRVKLINFARERGIKVVKAKDVKCS
ncbi:MAG: D-aminoacyl-tRNA deacylase [Candidatus Freyarchaeota archaeon]|nr:D-aminoacyl-tRNA deacylase [Candidatus Freyrarchaeum guaymaensis]